jgi:hypothetical protein
VARGVRAGHVAEVWGERGKIIAKARSADSGIWPGDERLIGRMLAVAEPPAVPQAATCLRRRTRCRFVHEVLDIAAVPALDHPAMRRGYRKRTPILRGVRQATSQPRFKHSGLMISVKVSGMAVGCSISRQAPLSERLRMTHSYRPRSNEIEPPLKVRCRGAFRSFMTRVVTIPYYPSVKSIPNFPTIRPGNLG